MHRIRSREPPATHSPFPLSQTHHSHPSTPRYPYPLQIPFLLSIWVCWTRCIGSVPESPQPSIPHSPIPNPPIPSPLPTAIPAHYKSPFSLVYGCAGQGASDPFQRAPSHPFPHSPFPYPNPHSFPLLKYEMFPLLTNPNNTKYYWLLLFTYIILYYVDLFYLILVFIPNVPQNNAL